MRRLGALLLAGCVASAVHAQAPNERARDHEDRATGNAAAPHSKMHHLGVDREAAIGHALNMAIEGSSLWHCAQTVEAKGNKTERKPGNEQAMRDPEAILEQRARDAFRASERLFQAVMQDEKGGPQKGRAGDRDVSKDQSGTDPMARHQACENFYRAARDYGRALETACSNTRQAGAQSPNSITSDACIDNAAKVALINYAVKEAVQGVGLQQMLHHHGEHDRTTQALESHAKEMIASSRHAIDSLGKATTTSEVANSRTDKAQARNDQGTTRRDAARPNYDDERAHSNLKPGEAITVQQLAKLGREVIRAVDQLNDYADQVKK